MVYSILYQVYYEKQIFSDLNYKISNLGVFEEMYIKRYRNLQQGTLKIGFSATPMFVCIFV